MDVFLSKSGKRRKPPSTGRDGGSRADDPIGDGGPDEAANFIAETVAELALHDGNSEGMLDPHA